MYVRVIPTCTSGDYQDVRLGITVYIAEKVEAFILMILTLLINFIYQCIDLFDWAFFAKAPFLPLSLHQKRKTKNRF